MKKLLLVLLLIVGRVFTQDNSSEDITNNFTTTILNNLTFEQKRDTIIYIKSISDKMIITVNGKHIKIFEIIKIGIDSIEVELLNYNQFQWKRVGSQYLPQANKKSPSLKESISIEDINVIRYWERKSVFILLKYILVAASIYAINYFI